jgi:CRP/FNR family transcriptional regulator
MAMVFTISQITNCIDCTYRSGGFNKLIQSELEFVTNNKTQITYKKGETIYKQNTFSNNIMYIVDGFAKKYLEGPNDRNLGVKIVQPREYIGLSSLFCVREHCHYSVTALTDTTLCLIRKNDFKKLITNNNAFAQEIIKWYCENDEQIFNKLKSINNKQMNGRIAEVILYINRDEFMGVRPMITRKIIAELAGISIESTIRILSSFKKDKIIDYNGKSIRVLNGKLLEQISENG